MATDTVAHSDRTSRYNRLVTVAVAFGSMVSFNSWLCKGPALPILWILTSINDRHMATAHPSLAAPLVNPVGMNISIYLLKASLDTAQLQLMQLLRPMDCTVQVVPLAVFSLCGLQLHWVGSCLFKSVLSSQFLVVLFRAEPQILGKLRNLNPLSTILKFHRMFHAGRIICGLGIGILVTACPMYLSELAPPQKRGWLVGHHAIFLVFGYMLSSWLGYACYFATKHNSSFAWRFPHALMF